MLDFVCFRLTMISIYATGFCQTARGAFQTRSVVRVEHVDVGIITRSGWTKVSSRTHSPWAPCVCPFKSNWPGHWRQQILQPQSSQRTQRHQLYHYLLRVSKSVSHHFPRKYVPFPCVPVFNGWHGAPLARWPIARGLVRQGVSKQTGFQRSSVSGTTF